MNGSARFEPGEAARLAPAMRSWARKVREREGCLRYRISADAEDPDLLHVAELWRDMASVEAHMSDLGPLMEFLAGARMEWLSLSAFDATEERVLMGKPLSAAPR